MTTIKQLVNRHRVSIKSEYADVNPHMEDSRNMNHFKVTLRMSGRQMTLYFSQGYGISGEPTASSVLSCLVSDAQTVLNARSFEDWASDLGYDVDSRKAERTFRLCEKETEKLRKFLGSDFDSFLNAETD